MRCSRTTSSGEDWSDVVSPRRRRSSAARGSGRSGRSRKATPDPPSPSAAPAPRGCGLGALGDHDDLRSRPRRCPPRHPLRPVRTPPDAPSVECGMGPICRAKALQGAPEAHRTEVNAIVARIAARPDAATVTADVAAIRPTGTPPRRAVARASRRRAHGVRRAYRRGGTPSERVFSGDLPRGPWAPVLGAVGGTGRARWHGALDRPQTRLWDALRETFPGARCWSTEGAAHRLSDGTAGPHPVEALCGCIDAMVAKPYTDTMNRAEQDLRAQAARAEALGDRTSATRWRRRPTATPVRNRLAQVSRGTHG